ncbi:MAG: SDR family oxidoreductase [Spirochaetaceae bacterium]|nr:SDR family oxidoreductase [Spirochaetaceae bacterium]
MRTPGQPFKDRFFIVSGGTQGLGRRIAKDLAEQGAAGVTICGRNASNGKQVTEEIEAAGSRGLYIQADLQYEKDCRRVIAEALGAFGTIHGLVNAAGITHRSSIEDATVDHWNLVMNINARAPFLLMQETVRHMKKKSVQGSIVNIISDQAHGGAPFLTVYSASKGALATLTKNAAHALKWDRIRVNGILIGWMNTPAEHQTQIKDGRPENWLEEAEAGRPFKRLLSPEDVSALVSYLLSDSSEMMTGSLIDFDQKVIGGLD